MKEYYIAVFKSKNYAMQIFYTLENHGYYFFDLISTPAQISGGCGYSIKFKRLSDIEYFRTVAGDLNSILQGVYSVERINGKRYYENITI